MAITSQNDILLSNRLKMRLPLLTESKFITTDAIENEEGRQCLQALTNARLGLFAARLEAAKSGVNEHGKIVIQLDGKDYIAENPCRQLELSKKHYNSLYNNHESFFTAVNDRYKVPEYLENVAYRHAVIDDTETMFLSDYVKLLALLNIPGIGYSARNKERYSFGQIFTPNIYHKGWAKILRDKDAMRPIFSDIITEVNDYLERLDKPYRVPKNIQELDFVNVENIYNHIERNTTKRVPSKKLVIPMPQVATRHAHDSTFESLQRNIEQEKQHLQDKTQTSNNYRAIIKAVSTLTSEKVSFKPEALPLLGEYFLYVVADSDLVAKAYVDTYISDLLKTTPETIFVIESDVTATVTETSYLRAILTQLDKHLRVDFHADELSQLRQERDAMSLSKLKTAVIADLLKLSDDDFQILFYLNSEQTATQVSSHEYATHVDRSFIERCLDEICFSVRKKAFDAPQRKIIANAIFAITGIYRGYEFPASCKVVLSPAEKDIWLLYADENLKSGKLATKGNLHSQGLARKVIAHVPVSDIDPPIVSALISVDATIKFQEVKRKVSLLNTVNNEFLLNREIDEFVLSAPASLLEGEGNPLRNIYVENQRSSVKPQNFSKQLENISPRFFWRAQLTESVLNHRTSLRLAKLLFFSFAGEGKLNYYYALLCIALCDNGLKTSSLLFISDELNLGFTSFTDFFEHCAPLLVRIRTSTAGEIERNYENEPEWELIPEVRKALFLHSHTYINDPDYKTEMEALFKANYFGNESVTAFDISREQISFAIAKLSCTLYINLITYGEELPDSVLKKQVDNAHKIDEPNHLPIDTKSEDSGESPDKLKDEDQKNAEPVQNLIKRRRRVKYYAIAIKHFLRAVGHRALNQELKREYQSYHYYLHNLRTMHYDNTAPQTLINFAWKLFHNGIEQQPEAEITEGFDSLVSSNHGQLLAELLRNFTSVSLPHKTRYFFIPQALSSALDDASFLAFLNAASMTYSTMNQSANANHVYTLYINRFAKYQRYTPNETIGRYLENTPVALLSRESISRVNLTHIRQLLDEGFLHRTKNLANELLSDLTELRKECIERLALMIKVVRLQKGASHWHDALPVNKVMQSLLLNALRRILKKELRYHAELLFIATSTGNMSSALKHFVNISAIFRNPIRYVMKDNDLSQLEPDNLHAMLVAQNRPAKNDSDDSEVENSSTKEPILSLVMRNRVLHHCMYYLFINHIYSIASKKLIKDDFEACHSGNTENHPDHEFAFYQHYTNRGVINIASNPDKKNWTDEAQDMYSSLLGKHQDVNVTGATFTRLRNEALLALKKYLVVQKEFLALRDDFDKKGQGDLNKALKNLRKKYPQYTPKNEEFYLILSLATNAMNAQLFDEDFDPNQISKKTDKNTKMSSLVDILKDSHEIIERLLESSTLRYTKHVHLRALLDEYRKKVFSNETRGFKYEIFKSEEHDIAWLETEFRSTQNNMALVELLLLKAFHLKRVHHHTDTEHSAQEAVNRMLNQILSELNAICDKSKVKMRDLDMSLLHKFLQTPRGKPLEMDRLMPLAIR